MIKLKGPTQRESLSWFGLMASHDQLASPGRWVWDTLDFAANSVLNANFFPPERRFRLSPRLRDARAPKAPSSRSEWESEHPRLPLGVDPTWLPCYFPDDGHDIRLLVGKHTWVTQDMAVRRQHLVGAMGAAGVPVASEGAARSAIAQSLTLFSLSRYCGFGACLPDAYPDFATCPQTRKRAFDAWRNGTWVREPHGVDEMLRWGEVSAFPDGVAEMLRRQVGP